MNFHICIPYLRNNIGCIVFQIELSPNAFELLAADNCIVFGIISLTSGITAHFLMQLIVRKRRIRLTRLNIYAEETFKF